MSPLCLLVAAVLLIAVPTAVQSCSCPQDASLVSRPDAITADVCATYVPNVYSGVVVSATCNCIPGTVSEQGGSSSTLNCQQYQLETNTISATVLTRGRCALEGYQDFYYEPACPVLGNALAGNLTVAVPSMLKTPEVNLTDGTRCREACPPLPSQDPFFSGPQPCVYTVRVTESFKGSYVQDTVVSVSGPDVVTSCGHFGRRLAIGTSYVVGIGGVCSPIGEWTQLNEYSSEDLALLRQLRDDGAPCATTELPTEVTEVTTVGSSGVVTEITTVGTGGASGVVTEVTTVGTGGASGVVPTLGILALMLITAFL